MTDKKTEALKLALEKVQEFKARWWKVPPFGNKVNKATREAITNAHSPIFELENTIREALVEQTAQQQCMEHGECFGGECIYPAPQPAQQQEPVAWAEFDFEAQKFTGRTAAKFSDVESVGHRCEWVPQLHQPTHQPAQQQEPMAYRHKWDKSGERCVKCGDKDWMGEACTVPDTSPPASKPWVGLTKEEILEINDTVREQQGWLAFVRAIEAKLREKNA